MGFPVSAFAFLHGCRLRGGAFRPPEGCLGLVEALYRHGVDVACIVFGQETSGRQQSGARRWGGPTVLPTKRPGTMCAGLTPPAHMVRSALLVRSMRLWRCLDLKALP